MRLVTSNTYFLGFERLGFKFHHPLCPILLANMRTCSETHLAAVEQFSGAQTVGKGIKDQML